jgi:N-acetylmuramoyl-L-alanine amidase
MAAVVKARVQSIRWFLPFAILIFVCLQCRQIGPPGGGRDIYSAPRQPAPRQPSPTSGAVSGARIMREVNLKVDMVRRGTHGRKVIRPMKPRYITIHSTQNYTADAYRHSLALKRGALRSPKTRNGNRIGYLIWHFTVDDRVAIQHMPTSEQGEHADFHGPGNRLSIGIEMCEHRGCSRDGDHRAHRETHRRADEKQHSAAQCGAALPLAAQGGNPPNKNCPHFLLDNGRPGSQVALVSRPRELSLSEFGLMSDPGIDHGSPGNREVALDRGFFMCANAAPRAASGPATCASRTMRSIRSPRFSACRMTTSSVDTPACDRTAKGLSLIEKDNHECIMLDGDSCRIHPVKPGQCAGFPNKWNFPGWRDVCKAVPVPMGEAPKP